MKVRHAAGLLLGAWAATGLGQSLPPRPSKVPDVTTPSRWTAKNRSS